MRRKHLDQTFPFLKTLLLKAMK